MTRISILKTATLLSLLTCVAFSTSSLFAEDKEKQKPEEIKYESPISKIELKDGDSIVFLGDSITHQCLYTQYFENYIYTRFPNKRIRMHNSGVGGAKAWDALQRFERDVADYKPKYVTILLGMNDGRYAPYTDDFFQTYRKDMTTVLEKIEAIGAKPILMTPTMFDARARRMNPRRKTDEETVSLYNSTLAYYGAWVREVAVKKGFGYVDMFGPLNQITYEERKKDPRFTLIRDAIHPDAPGQVVMATAMVRDMGLPRQLSYIRIRKNGKEMSATAQGGKVTDFKSTDDGLEFVWLADALPWVLPEAAELGVQLTKLGHKLTREGLEIHDLQQGFYQLTIDGTEIGKFHSSNLSRHIELQGNKKTPQYQQALKVAQLNEKRNAEHVRGLRNEWRNFQGYARFKATPAPTDEKALASYKKQIANYEKRMEGQDERIKMHEAKAKEMEDQIFEVNKPVPRKFVLKRVAAPVKPKKQKKPQNQKAKSGAAS